jgi:hypothetical protein
MTMLAAGYCAGPRRLAGRATSALSRRLSQDVRGPAVPWALFAAGLAAQAATAALTGQLGYVGDVAASVSSASGYQQALALAGECVPLSVAAAAVRACRAPSRGSAVTLAVLFAAAIGLGALAGGKSSFIVAILAVVVPRAGTARRLPRAALTGAIAAAPAVLGQVVTSDLSPAGLTRSADYLAQRIRTIDSPAIIVQRTPSQIPYGSGAELAQAPALDLIPRALWPGKPILAVGYQVSQQYYDLPASVYTASAVTPEGDLYRHGGWVPVVAGIPGTLALWLVVLHLTFARRTPVVTGKNR